MLFSGLNESSQQQVDVGVGVLAGTTIMVLTVPWACAIYFGRAPLGPDGQPDYSKANQEAPLFPLTSSGIVISSKTRVSSWIMVATCITYVMLQSTAMEVQVPTHQLVEPSENETNAVEVSEIVTIQRPVDKLSQYVCFVSFLAYCAYKHFAPWLLQCSRRALRYPSFGRLGYSSRIQ